MLFNLVSVYFAVFVSYTSRVAIVEAPMRDFDLNVSVFPKGSLENDKETNIQNRSSSTSSNNISVSYGLKRSRTEAGTTSSTCWKKNLKYRDYIDPINPTISAAMIDYLRDREQELEASGKSRGYVYMWKNHNTLEKDEARLLCMNTWKQLKQYITFEEVATTNNMTPDCDSALVLGARPGRTYCYIGFFQYLGKEEEKSFIPDMLRCNCAFLQAQGKRAKKLITVKNTTRFFFLLKMTTKVYYVLTMYGESKDRKVKIVNVYNHVTQ